MAKLLDNALVEAAIVLGIDESTGLTACKGHKGFCDTFRITKDGIMGPFQLHVLGILSGTAAIFPLARSMVDGGSYYPKGNVFCPSMDTEATHKERLRRSMSYASSTLESFPYSHEVIYSLATFCFPDGGYISQREREPHILYLVLTSIEGDRSYACCLIMDRKFKTTCVKNEENEIDLGVFGKTEESRMKGESENDNGEEDDMMVVYAPVGLCFLSRSPYFEAMRHCLSAFQESFQTDSQSWSAFLELCSQVFRVPIPPAGPVAIEFSIGGQTCIIPSADEPDRRPDDMELHWPLLVLSADDIILVITSILTQQRIIFLSSRYSLLTLVIESFFAYIEPFKWWLTYVPILPNKLADLIEAPGPFVMGCHSTLRKQINQVRKLKEIPDIVLVDLDEGKVDVDGKDTVPHMPDPVSQSLLLKFKRLKYRYDVDQVEKPKPRSIEEANQQRYRFKVKIAQEIKIACLDAMVSLFGETMSHMKFSDKTFHKKGYLEVPRLEDERAFYQSVTNSYAFDRFVDDRLENPERRDAFAVLSERFFSKRKSTVQRNRSSSNVSTLSKKASFSIAALLSVEKEIFTLPSIQGPDSGQYFENCVSILTEKIGTLASRSTKVKASYFYLRGMMHMACGQPIRALDDFFSLYLVGEELFPKEYVYDIMSSLNEADQQLLQEEEFYKRMADVRKYLRKKEGQKLKVSSRRLPNKPLKRENFIIRVKNLEIALNDASAGCLFLVLGGKDADISPEQFGFLYNTFFENEKHLTSMESSDASLDVDEKILAVSLLINSSEGMGRLILTNQVLYFMADGSRSWKSIIQVHDIKEVIKFKYYVVFPPGVPALRIVNKDRTSQPFFACLKDERELWISLLNEMAMAHEAAFSYKDPKIVEIASNNVKLATVIVKMGKSVKLAAGFCTYSRNRDSELDRLSEDTRESLERRVDPSERETRKVTVMSVIYVPGRSLGESATLWCGLGPGTIIVYETASWTRVSELRYAQHRIGCLLQADDYYVWAGSYDSVIYVINIDTRNTERRLSKHTGFICDMIQSLDESKTIWSATHEGQLLQWHIETCEPVREIIHLNGVTTLNKILFAAQKIWCVTTTFIIVVAPVSGKVLESITNVNGNKSSALFQYGCTLPDDTIWIAGEDKGQLFSVNPGTHEMQEIEANTSGSFSSMAAAGDSVWVGCKDGKVLIIDPQSHTILRELNAHTDVIKCMCVTREGHVVTGSSSRDGKLCIWNAEEKDRYESADSLGYEVVDGRRLKSVYR